MKIDRDAMIRTLQERIATTTNSTHAAQLSTIRDHMAAEIRQDIDAIMDTITPGPDVRFRTWGVPLDWMQPETHEAVRRYYLTSQANGDLYLEYDIERIAVDDKLVILDGIMTSLVPGATMAARSVPDAASEDVYAVRTRMLISWPFDNAGKIIGEEAYTVVISTTKVPPDEIPPNYWHDLRGGHELAGVSDGSPI